MQDLFHVIRAQCHFWELSFKGLYISFRITPSPLPFILYKGDLFRKLALYLSPAQRYFDSKIYFNPWGDSPCVCFQLLSFANSSVSGRSKSVALFWLATLFIYLLMTWNEPSKSICIVLILREKKRIQYLYVLLTAKKINQVCLFFVLKKEHWKISNALILLWTWDQITWNFKIQREIKMGRICDKSLNESNVLKHYYAPVFKPRSPCLWLLNIIKWSFFF